MMLVAFWFFRILWNRRGWFISYELKCSFYSLKMLRFNVLKGWTIFNISSVWFLLWLDLSQHVFSAIVLVLAAGISSHLCFGYSSKKSRETFICLILMIMMAFQAYHLIRAALYIPATRFFVLNPQLLRSDCLESVKGRHYRMMSVLNCTVLYCTVL